LENQRLHFSCAFFQAFAQYLLGAGMAFPATSADAETATQCWHRCLPAIHCVPYFAFGNIVANANDHANTLLVSNPRRDKKQNRLSLSFL
jgi:hypothetical protein